MYRCRICTRYLLQPCHVARVSVPYAIAGIGALVMRSALHMGCRRIGTAGAGSWMVGMGTAGVPTVALYVPVVYGGPMNALQALAATVGIAVAMSIPLVVVDTFIGAAIWSTDTTDRG